MTDYPCPICNKERKKAIGFGLDGYYATCGDDVCVQEIKSQKKVSTALLHGSPKRPKLKHYASIGLMHRKSLKCWRCGKPKSVGKAICDDCGKLTLGRRIAQNKHEDHWTFAAGVKQSKAKELADDVRKFDEMIAKMKTGAIQKR